MRDRGQTILVVDDDVSVRASLLNLLSEDGYRVVGAENGKQALELLHSSECRPSLVLLDLMMPVMDGWEFLAARRQERESKPPVVLLSGMTFIGDAAGVSDFLTKPIDASKLLSCVRRFCENAESPHFSSQPAN